MSKLTESVRSVVDAALAVLTKVPTVENAVVALELDDYNDECYSRANDLVSFNGTHDDRDLDTVPEVRRLERTGTSIFGYGGPVEWSMDSTFDTEQESPSLLITRKEVILEVTPAESDSLPHRRVTWPLVDGVMGEPTVEITVAKPWDDQNFKDPAAPSLLCEGLVEYGIATGATVVGDYSAGVVLRLEGGPDGLFSKTGAAIMTDLSAHLTDSLKNAVPTPS